MMKQQWAEWDDAFSLDGIYVRTGQRSAGERNTSRLHRNSGVLC